MAARSLRAPSLQHQTQGAVGRIEVDDDLEIFGQTEI